MANAGPVLGIDLGTTNSAVAIADGNDSRILHDPAGNKLHVAMPRFRMSLQDMEDLAAYVRQLGTRDDPGGWGLEALAPARSRKSRHGAIL